MFRNDDEYAGDTRRDLAFKIIKQLKIDSTFPPKVHARRDDVRLSKKKTTQQPENERQATYFFGKRRDDTS